MSYDHHSAVSCALHARARDVELCASLLSHCGACAEPFVAMFATSRCSLRVHCKIESSAAQCLAVGLLTRSPKRSVLPAEEAILQRLTNSQSSVGTSEHRCSCSSFSLGRSRRVFGDAPLVSTAAIIARSDSGQNIVCECSFACSFKQRATRTLLKQFTCSSRNLSSLLSTNMRWRTSSRSKEANCCCGYGTVSKGVQKHDAASELRRIKCG